MSVVTTVSACECLRLSSATCCERSVLGLTHVFNRRHRRQLRRHSEGRLRRFAHGATRGPAQGVKFTVTDRPAGFTTAITPSAPCSDGSQSHGHTAPVARGRRASPPRAAHTAMELGKWLVADLRAIYVNPLHWPWRELSLSLSESAHAWEGRPSTPQAYPPPVMCPHGPPPLGRTRYRNTALAVARVFRSFPPSPMPVAFCLLYLFVVCVPAGASR